MGRTSNITDAALNFSVTKPKRNHHNHYDQKLNSDFPQNFFFSLPLSCSLFFHSTPQFIFFSSRSFVLCCALLPLLLPTQTDIYHQFFCTHLSSFSCCCCYCCSVVCVVWRELNPRPLILELYLDGQLPIVLLLLWQAGNCMIFQNYISSYI